MVVDGYWMLLGRLLRADSVCVSIWRLEDSTRTMEQHSVYGNTFQFGDGGCNDSRRFHCFTTSFGV